ncbi:MAG: VCBS repeat-containing protein [Nocardioidaceae bacterium]
MRVWWLAAGCLVPLTLAAAATASTTLGPAIVGPANLVAVDRAHQAGLAANSRTYSATAVDYNRDGREDVWIGYHAQGAKLWKNKGNATYQRVAAAAWPKVSAQGKQIDRHVCAWADVDHSGRPDAYCTTGRFTNNFVKVGRDNELWLQSRSGRFRDVGTAWGVGDVCGRGRFVTFIFANRDHFADLVLGNDAPRVVSDPCDSPANHLPNERNKLYINTGGHGFRYAPKFWRPQPGTGSRCVQTLDFNRDGRQDLLTCGKVNQPLQLYQNMNGRRLVNVTSAHSLHSRVTDAVAADLNGDGRGDVVSSSSRGFAYHLNVNGLFQGAVRIGDSPVPRGVSVAAGDADGDGDIDVYGMVGAAKSNPDDVIWINDNLTFSLLDVPSAGGRAAQVAALDPRGNGTSSFLALNGFGRGSDLLGPIQLIRVTHR